MIVALLGQLNEAISPNEPAESASVETTFEQMLRLPDVYRNYLAVEDRRVVGLISMGVPADSTAVSASTRSMCCSAWSFSREGVFPW